MNEGEWRQFFELPFARGGVLAAEHDLLVVNGNDSAVGDGDAEEIAGEVEQGLVAGTDGLAVDHPVLFPDLRRHQFKQPGPFQQVAELGPEDGGDQLDPDQEFAFCRPPLAVVRAQATGRDQIMDMGVIAACPVPGMEHAGHGDLAADEAAVLGQLHDGGGRGLEQDRVDDFLVRTGQWPEFGRQGGGDEEMGDGQQFVLLFVQPRLCFLVSAFGTVPVFAGVIAVDDVAAVLIRAEVGVAAHCFGAAVFDVAHGPELAGQDFASVSFSVLRPMAAEDIRQFRHCRLEVGHELVDAQRPGRLCPVGEMGIDRGGGGRVVAEIFLDQAEIDACLQEVGGVGMPEGMDRGPLVDAGLVFGFLEGVLDAGPGERDIGNGLVQAVSAG